MNISSKIICLFITWIVINYDENIDWKATIWGQVRMSLLSDIFFRLIIEVNNYKQVIKTTSEVFTFIGIFSLCPIQLSFLLKKVIFYCILRMWLSTHSVFFTKKGSTTFTRWNIFCLTLDYFDYYSTLNIFFCIVRLINKRKKGDTIDFLFYLSTILIGTKSGLI